MTLYEIARDNIQAMSDGIAWLAVWRTGRNWNAFLFYPCYDAKTDMLVMEPEELAMLDGASCLDSHAILVNTWYHNLGVDPGKTRNNSRVLAKNLAKLHDEDLLSNLTDYLNRCCVYGERENLERTLLLGKQA